MQGDSYKTLDQASSVQGPAWKHQALISHQCSYLVEVHL